jgi:hypothetical protein
VPVSIGSFTFQESAPILPHNQGTSESAAKANWRSGAAFGNALFVRPAVMFGPDDAFLTTILKLLRQLPIYPMFGRGRPGCNWPMWEMLPKRLLESSGEPRRIRQYSSSAARASTLTRSFLEPLRTKLDLRPD